MLLHSLNHSIDSLLHAGSFVVLTDLLAQGDVVLTCDDEQTCNHQALCLGALAHVLSGLETLVGVPREAVEVQAVVPVGTAYQWQHVRTKILDDVVHRDFQVFKQRYLRSWLIVEWHHLIEN